MHVFTHHINSRSNLREKKKATDFERNLMPRTEGMVNICNTIILSSDLDTCFMKVFFYAVQIFPTKRDKQAVGGHWVFQVDCLVPTACPTLIIYCNETT